MTVSAYLLTLLVTGFSWAMPSFPTHPALELTPGSLCDQPTEFRYPEKIAYCERDVSTQIKKEVIQVYEEQFGYQIAKNRPDFKIDHFIPLCMGGSNKTDNLWPQHKTVYEVTDTAEFELCQKLSKGELTQKEAVRKIQNMKFSLQ